MECTTMCISKKSETRTTTKPRLPSTKHVPQLTPISSSSEYQDRPVYRGIRREEWGVRHACRSLIIYDTSSLLIFFLWGLASADACKGSISWLEMSPHCGTIWHQLSQCKELFKMVQIRKNKTPCQLLLDMKVRWGSTSVILNRAEGNEEVSNFFALISCLFDV